MIIHADLRDIPVDVVASCHAVITDPPYSAHVHESSVTGALDARANKAEARDMGFECLSAGVMYAIANAASLVSGWSLICSDLESVGIWVSAITDAGAEYVRTVPWVRFSQPQKTGDRPPSGCEAIVCSHSKWPAGPRGGARTPRSKIWNGPGNLVAFSAPVLRGADVLPCEKPLDLCLSMVSWFSQPGQTVLDVCAGSGAVGEACLLLGRKYVGVEIDSERAAFAEARLAAPLTERNRQRAVNWLAAFAADAVLEPRDKSEEPTYRRYLRRLKDRETVARAIGAAT